MRKYLLPLLIALLLAACLSPRRGDPTPTQPPHPRGNGNAARPNRHGPPGDPEAPPPPEGELDLGRIVDDIDWAPGSSPAARCPAKRALLDGAITIKFDQPMDQDSVEDAFTIEPAGGLSR